VLGGPLMTTLLRLLADEVEAVREAAVALLVAALERAPDAPALVPAVAAALALRLAGALHSGSVGCRQARALDAVCRLPWSGLFSCCGGSKPVRAVLTSYHCTWSVWSLRRTALTWACIRSFRLLPDGNLALKWHMRLMHQPRCLPKHSLCLAGRCAAHVGSRATAIGTACRRVSSLRP